MMRSSEDPLEVDPVTQLAINPETRRGRHVLAVVAFLPQGLNEALSKRILPCTQQIDTICDVLWRQSLIYRQGGFVKMLAPIRHYVRDSLPLPDSICLREIHTFYYRTVQRCSKGRDSHADRDACMLYLENMSDPLSFFSSSHISYPLFGCSARAGSATSLQIEGRSIKEDTLKAMITHKSFISSSPTAWLIICSGSSRITCWFTTARFRKLALQRGVELIVVGTWDLCNPGGDMEVVGG
ncbi:hypothetical protein EV702DRAFT_1271414 [Suillus placidus]|uniref:Uncharacterized protein n=1 Tax=Suillus placidus TaxID=48579 RepID=A0A9P6ZJX8_9AGAM|nr:hypothetical protein EV702DRAFT_1271414 [Suillus placidus]